MDYKTFKQEMTEDLKQRLYERGIEDVEMSFHNVEKANQHYELVLCQDLRQLKYLFF